MPKKTNTELLEENKNLKIGNYPQSAIHFIGLNQKNKILSNPKV